MREDQQKINIYNRKNKAILWFLSRKILIIISNMWMVIM